MSREVCGLCWCPYDENTGECACAPAPKEPVAGRAFLERILTAMEGVIDVADRKTDEFDALRSCVIDLTMMLHTAPPQRPAEPATIAEWWADKQRNFCPRCGKRANGIHTCTPP